MGAFLEQAKLRRGVRAAFAPQPSIIPIIKEKRHFKDKNKYNPKAEDKKHIQQLFAARVQDAINREIDWKAAIPQETFSWMK